MSKDTVSEFMEKYRKQKGDPNQKYANYLAKLHQSKKAGAKTIAGAFNLLEKSTDPIANQVARRIKENRFVVVVGELGGNRACLREPGVFDKSGVLTDGVIVVDPRYVGNMLGTAGTLAHEVRHVLDLEETKAGRLKIGIRLGDQGSLNESRPQNRADAFAGHVVSALGYKKGMKLGLSTEEKEAKKRVWGNRWMQDAEELIDPKVSKLQEFGSDKKRRAVFCGRGCSSKPGTCKRRVYFPPCWDH